MACLKKSRVGRAAFRGNKRIGKIPLQDTALPADRQQWEAALSHLFRTGQIFSVVRKGETEHRFCAAKCLREGLRDPRNERVFACEALLRLYPDLCELPA